MTDRMSNVEIEDVLSSIRRLVSDELRPLTPARKAQPRLVLTPALRVDLPAATEPPDKLAATLAELELMLDAQDQPFEPESEDLPELSAAPVWQAAEPEPDLVPEAPFVIVPETAGEEEEDPAPEPAPVLDWTGRPPVVEAAAAEPAPEDGYRLLDEAVLRDLIRDVLREELQGGMGERVTRNLRKMVRSELARALTARGIT